MDKALGERSAALLLTSLIEDATNYGLRLTPLTHRYCRAASDLTDLVQCSCEHVSREDVETRIALRDQVFGQLLPVLVHVLNKQHCLEMSEKEGLLLVGHWLKRLVTAFVQRYCEVERHLSRSKFNYLVTSDDGHHLPVAKSTADATKVFNSESWEQYAYETILESFPAAPQEKIRIKSRGDKSPTTPKQPELDDKIRQRLLNGAQFYTQVISKRAKTLIFVSYLPRIFEVKLHILLHQPPQFWKTDFEPTPCKPDRSLRLELSELAKSILSPDASNLTELIGREMFANLPISFLEGFDDLTKQAFSRGFPRMPEVIFTSNAFDGDDAFKLYVVKQKSLGATYVVGQHGNNYGTLKSMSPSIEELTSSRFITWGWRGALQTYEKGFVLKLANKKIRRRPSSRYLLLQLHRDNCFALTDSFFDHENYFSRQLLFANSLEDQILENLEIRLHPTTSSYGWGEEAEWRRRLRTPPVFSKSKANIYREFSKSRIVIHSYDSTGLLECLSQNIPTVAFWGGGLDHLTDDVKPMYNLLVDAGIIHFSPEALAAHLNEVGDGVEEWWKSKEVQNARARFCTNFAQSSKEPLRELRRLLQPGPLQADIPLS